MPDRQDPPAWLLERLRCPRCRQSLEYISLASGGQGLLVHETGCEEVYPVIDGVPRILVDQGRAALRRRHRTWFDKFGDHRALSQKWTGQTDRDPLVAAFDDEWARFAQVGTSELTTIAGQYFDLVPEVDLTQNAIALDAGSGSGRWSLEVARRGPRVIAIDLGASIEQVARAAPAGRVECVQADLHALPLCDAAVDWSYSLGVLHHLAHPERALAEIVRATRPGGDVLLYLYYALDGRGIAYRAIFGVADLARKVLSRAPRWIARGVAAAIAITVYWPLARTSYLLERAGLRFAANALPLAFYRYRSLRIMLNDSLDRFGTTRERRYRRDQMEAFMVEAGLIDLVVSPDPPYWHALGRRSPVRAQ